MELTESVAFEDGKLCLLLEQILLKNQIVKHFVEGSECQDDEDIIKCVPELTALCQQLSNAFLQQLKYMTNTLHATFQLLTSLQEKYKQLTSRQVLVDYLARVCELLQDAASYIGKTETNFQAISRQYSTFFHQPPTILPEQDDHTQKDEKEKTDITESEKCIIRDGSEKIRPSQPCEIKAASDTLKADQEIITPPSVKANGFHTEQEVNKILPKQKAYEDYKPTESEAPEQNNESEKEQLKSVSEIKGKQIVVSSSSETCNETSVNYMDHSQELGNQWSEKEFLVQENGEKEAKVACYIKAPFTTVQNIKCKIINDMSSLVVSDFEELVSNVIIIEGKDPGLRLSFPICIVIPFCTRFKGNYRDIMVKVNDEKLQSSYLTPIGLEGYQKNQQGSFAEVKVYKLGIFSVVSCLKKETFSIPKKGLEVKPTMDPRISLIFPPGCFSSSIIVQLKVQPIDAALISILKVKQDIYQSVVSTSPLVHIQQPSSQSIHRLYTVTLPCPPNPEKKRQGDETDHRRAASATVPKTTTGHQISFIVIRLSSVMDGAHLLLFIQALDQAAHNTMVSVVLYRRKEDLQKAIVELVPSKELNWEIPSLRAEGYFGPPEPSEQIPMREGEQIHFRFNGNIFASDNGEDFGKSYKLTFHSQRKHRLQLQLKVVDEFGNYSSPHYKGTAVFYKLSRESIVSNFTQPCLVDEPQLFQAPICKLALTLPKIEKIISRPPSTRQVFSNSSEALLDNLLYWLAEELSEEDANLLALSLPIRRSTIQLIKLKSPENLTDQIYELLSFWKKNLPTSADKMRLLSRHLRKSGRTDLFEELKSMWENKVVPRQAQYRFGVNY
ncbi:death domain-containing protein 1 isoform X2 [Rhinatrema bivittatum]|uniref:death domain-containing protein 1 isoform X2 n=1 Tax=Rhinatrema bivittatum TaxID=194408 RepID=UPI00112BE3C6|nr:death domain-containing protein 1 isoform X2 [Rhinatrema bivittatum]